MLNRRTKKICIGANFALLSWIFLVLVFLTPFNDLLPPLAEVECANCFDFRNPWEKEVVSDLKTFAHKGCQIATAKKAFTDFFSFVLSVKISFCSHWWFSLLLMVFCPHLFRFSESLGKSNGKKWSQIIKLLLINGVKSPCKKVVFFQRNLPY